MALWGNSDNVTSAGTVTLNYATGICTGSNTAFGDAGSAQEGDVIRFGDRSGTYFGDAVIVSIASTTQLTIGSTAGLSGVAIAATSFTVSQCPVSSIGDVTFSESASGTEDKVVYGVAAEGVDATTTSKYAVDHGGWVGVTTYVDQHGELRVKKEVLVAMSGITTGNAPVYDADPLG
jgi:hypothetical protein